MVITSRIAAGLALTALMLPALALPARASGPAAVGPQTITTLPYEIVRPGSYVLAGDLTGPQGITIAASDVTLDLGGHALTGTADSAVGITVRGNQTDLEIRDGLVAHWGGHGILADSAFGTVFRDLRVVANGGCGLRSGHGALLDGVFAEDNGGSGVQGFGSVTVGAAFVGGNMLWGLDLGPASSVQGATVLMNGAGGVLVADGSLVRDNVVRGNGWLVAAPEAASCTAGTLAGIAVMGAGTFVERNTVTANGIGLQLLGAGNTVAGNVVSGNAQTYDFVAGNQLDLLVSELPLLVTWPAKLTLAGSLIGGRGQVGLEIDADDVTVDLAGHALIGVPGSLCGILVRPGHTGVRVRDGFLTAWDGCGVNGEQASGLWLEALTAHGNGSVGLRAGDGSHVVACLASGNGDDGVQLGQDAVVSACTLDGNGNDGLQVGPHSTVTQVTASENDHFGIRAAEGSSVLACTASNNTLGIAVTRGCLVQQCTTSFNDLVGIRAEQACLLKENLADGNAYGLAVLQGPGSRIEGNHLTNNSTGMDVSGTGNLVIANACFGNGTAYVVVADTFT